MGKVSALKNLEAENLARMLYGQHAKGAHIDLKKLAEYEIRLYQDSSWLPF